MIPCEYDYERSVDGGSGKDGLWCLLLMIGIFIIAVVVALAH